MAEKMLPFRRLLKPGTPFCWDEHLNGLFEKSKAAIISKIEEGVRIFDKSKPTCLATDCVHPSKMVFQVSIVA
jgi:hypothetical protein